MTFYFYILFLNSLSHSCYNILIYNTDLFNSISKNHNYNNYDSYQDIISNAINNNNNNSYNNNNVYYYVSVRVEYGIDVHLDHLAFIQINEFHPGIPFGSEALFKITEGDQTSSFVEIVAFIYSCWILLFHYIL